LTTQPQQTDDPFDSAETVEWVLPIYTVYGQVTLDATHVALVKGDKERGIKGGKVPFDPAVHASEKRFTSVEITILPVVPGRYVTFRDMLAESKEWATIVRPSIKAIGLDPRSINERWIQAELVPTGRKYQKSDGSEGIATTVKFVRVFNDDQECFAAAQAKREDADVGAAPATSVASAAATPAVAGPSQGMVRQFLGAIVKKWLGDDSNDLAELDKRLSANPLTKAYSSESPEIAEIIAAGV